jgi:hypothetical protein
LLVAVVLDGGVLEAALELTLEVAVLLLEVDELEPQPASASTTAQTVAVNVMR